MKSIRSWSILLVILSGLVMLTAGDFGQAAAEEKSDDCTDCIYDQQLIYYACIDDVNADYDQCVDFAGLRRDAAIEAYGEAYDDCASSVGDAYDAALEICWEFPQHYWSECAAYISSQYEDLMDGCWDNYIDWVDSAHQEYNADVGECFEESSPDSIQCQLDFNLNVQEQCDSVCP